MKTFPAILIAVLLIAWPLNAAADKVHNHDPEIVGSWFSNSSDGSLTELTLKSTGKFILDQRSGNTPERTYMCGTWERYGDDIDVEVQAQKSREANGDISEASSFSNQQFDVIKATSNTLVLRINNSVVSFFRNG